MYSELHGPVRPCEIYVSGPPTQFECITHDVLFDAEDEGVPDWCPVGKEESKS